MRMMVRLSRMSGTGIEVYRKLEPLFPATGTMYLPADDPRVIKAVEIYERAGWKPRIPAEGGDRSKEYDIGYERIYEEGDFEAVELAEIHPEYLFEETWPKRLGGDRTLLEEGRLLELGVEYLQGGHDCAFTELGGFAIAVPNRVRRLFEKGGLAGVSFRETVPLVPDGSVGKPVPWREVGEPWWELTSTALMPPVSSTMDLRAPKTYKRIEPGATSTGCYRFDGLYSPVELHYRRQDLRTVPPFDLAHTLESFSGAQYPDPLRRSLVASKRFYDFCQEHSLKIGWVPVRLEE